MRSGPRVRCLRAADRKVVQPSLVHGFCLVYLDTISASGILRTLFRIMGKIEQRMIQITAYIVRVQMGSKNMLSSSEHTQDQIMSSLILQTHAVILTIL